MATLKVFIGGMPTKPTYRSIEKARQALEAAKIADPSAHIVIRERRSLGRGMVGWSNVNSWLNNALKVPS